MKASARPFFARFRPIRRRFDNASPETRAFALLFLILPILGLLVRATRLGPALGTILVLLIVLAWLRRHPRPLRRTLTAIFVLHVLLLAVDLTFEVVPQRDSRLYDQLSLHYAQTWHGEPAVEDPFVSKPGDNPVTQKDSPAYQARLFVLPVAALFYFFGGSFALARFAMTAIGLLAPFFLYRILARSYPEKWAMGGILVYAAWPTLAHLHTDFLRDNLIIVLLVASVDCISKWWRAGHARSLVQGLALFFVAAILRIPNLVLLPLFAFFPIARRLRGRGRRVFVQALAGFVIISALLVVALGGPIISYVFRSSDVSPKAIEDVRRGWGGGNTAYHDNETFATWTDVAEFAPIGFVYFLLVPTPWQTAGEGTWLVILENVFWYYPLIILGLVGLVHGWRLRGHSERLFAAILLFSAFLVYGMVEANIGTVVRHRSQFQWAWIILAMPILVRLMGWVERNAIALHVRRRLGALGPKEDSESLPDRGDSEGVQDERQQG